MHKSMKNIINKVSLLIIIISTSISLAQNNRVSYKVTNDEPKNVLNLVYNIDVGYMDVPTANIDGFCVGFGTWGTAMYKNRMGIDHTLRFGYLFKNIFFQPGGYFIFHQKEKEKNLAVVMKGEQEGNYIKSTYIAVPTHLWKYKALRGGIYFKRGTTADLLDNSERGPDYRYNLFGLYGGICFGRTEKLAIITDEYGNKGSAGHLRYCFDIIFTPITNSINGLRGYDDVLYKGRFTKNPLGARFIFQSLPAVTKKEAWDKYNLRFAIEMELGWRAVDGPYVAFGWSIPMGRYSKKLGSTNSEPVRTAE